MPKRFILTVVFATALFVGAYMVWTTWISPQAAAVAEDALPAQGSGPSASITVNPTIVTASLNKDGVPEKLGSLSLTGSQSGKEALVEFEKLHGQGFDLVGGYRADYASGDSKATVWVGQTKDASTAQKLLKEMADKIGAGNAMFKDLQELSVANRTLYQVTGQGQSHFFFASNDKIVWLAADATYAPDALHSLWGAVK